MKKDPPFIQSLQKASMDKGRTKFFLSFLLLSFILWFLTKFSNDYTEVVVFTLKVEDIPGSILPILPQDLQVEATLKASGFQFLYYQFIDNELKTNASIVTFEQGKASIPLAADFQQLQDQLLGETQILNLFPTTLEFDYQVQSAKRVPVQAPQLDLALGYAINTIRFVPDSINIIGPSDQLEKIHTITPAYVSSQPIRSSFNQSLSITGLADGLIVEVPTVMMEVDVDRFSEKSFQLPITKRNFPSGKVIKFFPNTVKVTFLAPLKQLKNIEIADFEIGVDFEGLTSDKKTNLELFLAPEHCKNIRWEPASIDYLIRQ